LEEKGRYGTGILEDWEVTYSRFTRLGFNNLLLHIPIRKYVVTVLVEHGGHWWLARQVLSAGTNFDGCLGMGIDG